MQFPSWQNNAFRQSSIAHDTESLVMLAAVGEAPSARIALLAIDVRFHTASISHLNTRNPFSNRQDFDTQFMPWDPGIGKEREFSQVSAEIGSAHADTMDPNQHFARPGRLGFSDVDLLPKLRLN
jgi:hypothetical protein